MVSFVAGAAIGVALEKFVFAKMQENGIVYMLASLSVMNSKTYKCDINKVIITF